MKPRQRCDQEDQAEDDSSKEYVARNLNRSRVELKKSKALVIL